MGQVQAMASCRVRQHNGRSHSGVQHNSPRLAVRMVLWCGLFPLQHYIHHERHLLLGHDTSAFIGCPYERPIHIKSHAFCGNRRNGGIDTNSNAHYRCNGNRRQHSQGLRNNLHSHKRALPSFPMLHILWSEGESRKPQGAGTPHKP